MTNWRSRWLHNSGQSLVEVTIGIVFLCMAVLVLIDLSMIVIASSMNNSACQHAAWAAASGAPAEAMNRAQAVIDSINSRGKGNLLSTFRIAAPAQMDITSSPARSVDPDYPGKTFSVGGPITGTATVVTEVTVHPFMLEHMFGPLRFSSRQSAPITYIAPPDPQILSGALPLRKVQEVGM